MENFKKGKNGILTTVSVPAMTLRNPFSPSPSPTLQQLSPLLGISGGGEEYAVSSVETGLRETLVLVLTSGTEEPVLTIALKQQ